MKILGISGGEHSCGLAYLDNGKPIFAFEEERHNRIKTYKDFEKKLFRSPYECGQNVPYNEGFDWNEIDYITSHFDEDITSIQWYNIGLGPFPQEKFIKVDHHEAHCNLAYYCSGFKESTLVISLDGGGGEHYGKYYLGENGNLEYIGGINMNKKSLGQYYCMLTEFLGWKRLKDEGKVVGLASHGKFVQWIYNVFNECITVTGHTTDNDYHKNEQPGNRYKLFKDFYTLFNDKNPNYMNGPHGYLREDIAFNGQLVFEEKILQIISSLKKEYPQVKKIALSGGVFANVKLNKKINELKWVEEVFITPSMDDNGLPLGCALTVHKQKNKKFQPFKLNNTFLGTQYKDSEFNYDKKKFTERPYNEEEIAYDLKEGKVIGWFQGKYEHGPRALCNRSILADPSIPGTYKKINDKLQRNDRMPFAPVVIDKYVDELFYVDKSKYTAEFMTMLYDTKEKWQDKIPAVVHPIDKTARIQIVTNNSNSKFYNLINKFNNITGIPILLNTSFNIHDEPIVCHPKEAFVHLDNNIVDRLVINNKTYTKK